MSLMNKRPAHFNITWTFQAEELQTSLTWSDQGPSTDGCNVAAHVYRSDFGHCWAVSLLPSIRWTVRGTGLAPCRGLRSLTGILDQWGGLNGHRALLQTESLQGLSLRGGRGRHLLATDGKILDLILAETKWWEMTETERDSEWIRTMFLWTE